MRHIATLLSEAEHNFLLNLCQICNSAEIRNHDSAEDEVLQSIIKKFIVPLETGSKTDEDGTTRALFPLDLKDIIDIQQVNETCDDKIDKVLSELSYFPVALEVEESESRYSIVFGTLWLNAIGYGDDKEEPNIFEDDEPADEE